MTEQQKKILAVLDMSEEEQMKWLIDKGITDGSLAVSQVSGKIVKRWINIELADLAFKLSNGKLAGKKSIEYIIDALLAKESK